MLTNTIIGLASFAAGIGVAVLWRAMDNVITQGRAAYLAFINTPEERE